MEKYQTMEKLGDGAFGVVRKALNKTTGETVAIKKLLLKFESSNNQIMINREVKSLIFNKNHRNIITLKEVINQNNTIFLVFEYMKTTLYDLMFSRNKNNPLSETEIRYICFQIFQGLAHMHNNGYIHRDLKPENVLVSENNVVKIGDFGLSRETNGETPYTDNVTTRGYRAPEVFLRSSVYGPAVDMWAMGVIMAELFASEPLFQGFSDLQILYRICSVLGTPTESVWSHGLELARDMIYQFPRDLPGVRFPELLPTTASVEAVDLIGSLLSWNPNVRPTATQALRHPFFDSCYAFPLVRRDASLSLALKLRMLGEFLKKKLGLAKRGYIIV